MGKIYCIIGKSGTGKDTVLCELLKDENIRLEKIVPYTTRPKRDGEVEGVNYHYVSVDELEVMEREGKVIERRTYDTIHGPWNYFTASTNISNVKDYIIITTQKALEHFFSFFGKERIHVIYLLLNDKIRLERCIARESQQINPNYSEVCRRFLADEEDFDEDAIKNYQHYTIVDTANDLNIYTNEIKKIITNNNEV